MLGSDQIINMHAHEMRGNNCRESTEYQHPQLLHLYTSDRRHGNRTTARGQTKQPDQAEDTARTTNTTDTTVRQADTNVSLDHLTRDPSDTPVDLPKASLSAQKRPRTRSQMRYKVVSIRIHGDTRNVVVCVVHSAGRGMTHVNIM